MQRVWIALGAAAGLGAVAMAALAAHALSGLDPAALAMVRSGIEMQAWHALALLGVAAWSPRGGKLADAAGVAFVAGIVLFCGGVYAVGLAGMRVGMAAPIGGTLLMVGWGLLAVSAVIAPRRE